MTSRRERTGMRCLIATMNSPIPSSPRIEGRDLCNGYGSRTITAEIPDG